jgi:enolase
VSRISSVDLAPVYDSRGRLTVEATVELASGARGRAAAPSGASTGTHEARAFPSGGVPEALAAFRQRLVPALRGLDLGAFAELDRALRAADPSPDFAGIGGNTATALSVAGALALGAESGRPLWKLLAREGVDGSRFPAIVGNCLNGGRHAIGGPDIQEFIAFSDERRPEDSVRAAVRVHEVLGEELHRRYPKAALGRGDEGGWVAAVGNVEALELLSDACARVRDELDLEVYPGLDFAASEFFRDGRYRYKDQTLDPEGQAGFVAHLIDRYGVRYVEDPFDQEAYDSFAALTRAVGDRALVVGDDIYCTSVDRLRPGVAQHASSAVLIKVNQVGTLSDTLATVDLARAHGMRSVASHRSGEVPDVWLSHVALGIGARGLKCGVLGGERVAKLNELLRLARATPTA